MLWFDQRTKSHSRKFPDNVSIYSVLKEWCVADRTSWISSQIETHLPTSYLTAFAASVSRSRQRFSLDRSAHDDGEISRAVGQVEWIMMGNEKCTRKAWRTMRVKFRIEVYECGFLLLRRRALISIKIFMFFLHIYYHSLHSLPMEWHNYKHTDKSIARYVHKMFDCFN